MMNGMEAPPYSAALEGQQNLPKYGRAIPNRIFVGGISENTTTDELGNLFSAYGNVQSVKIIFDQRGVSKRYGFVTFETEEEAQKLQAHDICICMKGRKLVIAPAIKKNDVVTMSGAVYFAPTANTLPNMPMEQFTPTIYQPDANIPEANVQPQFPQLFQYQPMYQYYDYPIISATDVNAANVWPQNFQGLYPLPLPDFIQ